MTTPPRKPLFQFGLTWLFALTTAAAVMTWIFPAIPPTVRQEVVKLAVLLCIPALPAAFCLAVGLFLNDRDRRRDMRLFRNPPG